MRRNAAAFKATPMPLGEPFEPIKCGLHIEPVEVVLHTSMRAEERRQFDERQRQREHTNALYQERQQQHEKVSTSATTPRFIHFYLRHANKSM